MRKIVVGYDGSDTATRAAQEALALARATGAELHMVTVVDDAQLRQGMITAEQQQRAEQSAAAELRSLPSTDEPGSVEGHSGVIALTEVVSGSPADRLVEYAEKIDADLLVVGNRRVQGISRVLGSVAIAVLRHAPCSVYVAHTA